jgi:hypothetical protein
MVDPRHLLDLAREMTKRRGAGAPRQVVLRRTISTAYYAVFHALLGRTASTFVPSSLWKSRVLFYRALDHTRAKDRCKRLGLKSLPLAEKNFFEFDCFSENLRAFANTFVELQELRHESDYDPDTKFSKDEAKEAIENAARAIECLWVADGNEANMFLAYLLFGIRSA